MKPKDKKARLIVKSIIYDSKFLQLTGVRVGCPESVLGGRSQHRVGSRSGCRVVDEIAVRVARRRFLSRHSGWLLV